MAFFGRKDEEPTEHAVVEQIKSKTAQEIATADVTELVNNMTKSCFALCFQEPKAQFSVSESQCVTNCARKFMSAWNVVSHEYIQRLQQ